MKKYLEKFFAIRAYAFRQYRIDKLGAMNSTPWLIDSNILPTKVNKIDRETINSLYLTIHTPLWIVSFHLPTD